MGLKEVRRYWKRVAVCCRALCGQTEPGGGAAPTVVRGAPRSYLG